jgi:tRNA(adenine34) deaminase
MTRRRALVNGGCAVLVIALARQSRIAPGAENDARWYRAAAAMRQLAESWGDQPYGAVLVLDGAIVGEGPSRVVTDRDPDAHAERVAIRDAQRRLGRTQLAGSVLYSTSRPCSLCEAAAARAGVGRMIHGEALVDAGPPRE